MTTLQLCSGNQALAWGAHESGVMVAAGYPGTPCTEVIEELAKYPSCHCEWSINEKIALETVTGASFYGHRSLAVMKTLGLNVAADALMQVAGSQLNGGLVIVVADDVGRPVGDDLEDGRGYAVLAQVPCLEPVGSQECYEYIKHAFALSEEYSTPVIVRMTTSTCKLREILTHDDGPIPAPAVRSHYSYSCQKTLLSMYRFGFSAGRTPAVQRFEHDAAEHWRRLQESAETTSLNRIEGNNKALAIVCSGITYRYAKEVYGERATILKLGLSYPVAAGKVRALADAVDRLVVIEDGQAIVEKEIRALGIRVHGTDVFPRYPNMLAFDADLLAEADLLAPELRPVSGMRRDEVPLRLPSNCAGCMHTLVQYYLKRSGYRVAGGIGCGGLGACPHLQKVDIVKCMGSAIGIAAGYNRKRSSGPPMVAVMGDSEFWHTGLSSVVSAYYNEADVGLVVCDNAAVAMTGGQDNPSSGAGLNGRAARQLSIAGVCKGIMGPERVSELSTENPELVRRALTELGKRSGVFVLVVHAPCRVKKRSKSQQPRQVVSHECSSCGTCLDIGCTALSGHRSGMTGRAAEPPSIHAELCAGCGLCERECPSRAIATCGDAAGGS